MLPYVSVIMSVHNGAKYLNASIDSILAQTYANFEFIIIDDCSSDETPAILETYSKKDSRIRIIRNSENEGLTVSLNIGLAQAQGKYIARQDADDISEPQRFEKQVQYLEENPTTALVASHLSIIDEQGQQLDTIRRSVPSSLIRWYMLFYNYVGGHSSVMFRRETALKVGSYNEKFRYSQDYDLWVRLLTQGEITILPEILVHWRTHPTNISGQRFGQQEQLSLLVSQRMIHELTQHVYPLELIADLRRFWLNNDAAACRNPKALNPIIKEILHYFEQHHDTAGIPQRIAERYIRHARHSTLFHKLTLWRYAANWHRSTLTNEIKHQIKRKVEIVQQQIHK